MNDLFIYHSSEDVCIVRTSSVALLLIDLFFHLFLTYSVISFIKLNEKFRTWRRFYYLR